VVHRGPDANAGRATGCGGVRRRGQRTSGRRLPTGGIAGLPGRRGCGCDPAILTALKSTTATPELACVQAVWSRLRHHVIVPFVNADLVMGDPPNPVRASAIPWGPDAAQGIAMGPRGPLRAQKIVAWRSARPSPCSESGKCACTVFMGQRYGGVPVSKRSVSSLLWKRRRVLAALTPLRWPLHSGRL
jgi:hypothetical protein